MKARVNPATIACVRFMFDSRSVNLDHLPSPDRFLGRNGKQATIHAVSRGGEVRFLFEDRHPESLMNFRKAKMAAPTFAAFRRDGVNDRFFARTAAFPNQDFQT